MSIAAIQWAMRQKTRNSSTQCLLMVLADAADPEGVAFSWWKSRDHWWPYLVDKTRLSRGAVFRLLGELQDKGYFERGETKPAEGGRAQPIIKLIITRDVLEPEAVSENESTSETGEVERTPPETTSQSTAATENRSTAATENAVASPPQRPAESTLATARDVPVLNPLTPQSPPLRKPIGLDEANGFGAFWNDYPDHQAMNRDSALRAFSELTEQDQITAVKTVSFYARDIAKLRRRPVSPANWLKGKRFNEYGVGRQSSAASGGLQLVPENTEPWKAWCAVAAVRFGGGLKIPYHWGGQEQRGAWRPTLWPLGADAWLTPYDRWIFVERGTAQHGRWCERIAEMLESAPVPRQLSTVRPSRMILVGGVDLDHRPQGQRDPLGLLVPLEWPPPKGEKKSEAQKQSTNAA